MKWRAPNISRCLALIIRPMHRVGANQCFGAALPKINISGLNVEVKEKEVIQEEDAIEGELDNG